MWFNNFAPRKQPRDSFGRDCRCSRLAALLVSGQLSELGSQDRVPHLGNFFGAFTGADGFQYSPHRIQSALCIIVGELGVVSEFVTYINKLIHDRSMCPIQNVAKRIIPKPLHDLQELLGIERKFPVTLWPPMREPGNDLLWPLLA